VSRSCKRGADLRNWYRSGPYFFRGLALAVLATVILFTVPIKSIRLFPRRLVAFVIDLLLFSVGTIGLVSLLFEVGTVKPSALTSMAIVWMWVLLFVVSDWAFTGTHADSVGAKIKTCWKGMLSNGQDWRRQTNPG